MDAQELARRAFIARRLKAARWLAADAEAAKDDKGKVGFALREVSQVDLVKRDPLAANKFKASKIGAIERMERHTPPMELYALIEALDLPADWFDFSPDDDLERAERLLREAAQAAQEPGQEPEEEAEDDDEQDHPEQGRGDAGA